MQKEFEPHESTPREKAIAEGAQSFVVGACITRDQKLLLVRRVAGDFKGGFYELPGGGVETNETLEKTLQRETKEEIGLEVTKIIGTIEGFDYLSLDNQKTHQFNFIVEVEDGEIKLAPDEHDHYLWVGKEDLDKIELSPEIKKVVNNFFTYIRFK